MQHTRRRSICWFSKLFYFSIRRTERSPVEKEMKQPSKPQCNSSISHTHPIRHCFRSENRKKLMIAIVREKAPFPLQTTTQLTPASIRCHAIRDASWFGVRGMLRCCLFAGRPWKEGETRIDRWCWWGKGRRKQDIKFRSNSVTWAIAPDGGFVWLMTSGRTRVFMRAKAVKRSLGGVDLCNKQRES